MRTYVRRAALTLETQPTHAQCNKCGKQEDFTNMGAFKIAPEDIHTFSVSGGFGSSYPGDDVEVKFDLCGTCLKEITGTFLFPAEEGWERGARPILCYHHETMAPMIAEDGWLREEKDEKPTTYNDYNYYDHMVTPGVWQHAKSENLYEVLDTVFLVGTKEPWVIYRALYDDSKTFARPVAMFLETVNLEKEPKTTTQFGIFRSPRFVPYSG